MQGVVRITTWTPRSPAAPWRRAAPSWSMLGSANTDDRAWDALGHHRLPPTCQQAHRLRWRRPPLPRLTPGPPRAAHRARGVARGGPVVLARRRAPAQLLPRPPLHRQPRAGVVSAPGHEHRMLIDGKLVEGSTAAPRSTTSTPPPRRCSAPPPTHRAPTWPGPSPPPAAPSTRPTGPPTTSCASAACTQLQAALEAEQEELRGRAGGRGRLPGADHLRPPARRAAARGADVAGRA